MPQSREEDFKRNNTFIWPCPITKTPALRVMKCLCSHCCIPSLSDLEEKILKKIHMYINFTLLPQYNLPMWGHKIYNFLSQSYTIQIGVDWPSNS